MVIDLADIHARHRRVTFVDHKGEPVDHECYHCGRQWPCETVQLAERCAELQRDAVRLDWIQAHATVFSSAIELDHDAWFRDTTNLRAAVDRAIEEQTA